MKITKITAFSAEPYFPYVPFQTHIAETGAQNCGLMPAVPVTVPGSLYDALVKVGYIEDPNFELNSFKARWVADMWWVYTSKVVFHPLSGERTELVLEGIDFRGHVYLNGKLLGVSENMFLPFVSDVTDLLRDGENTVTVVLENAPEEMGQIGYTSRVRYLKSRFNYQWDWCTRLISIGLFRPVYLRSFPEVRLEDFYFKPVGTDGDAELYVTLHGKTDGLSVKAEIGGFETEIPVKKNQAKTRLKVENAKLWYPNGFGDQPLYALTLTVMKDGAAVDTYTKKVGFRDLRLTPNDDKPLGALDYVFTVNGKKVYAKGANLAPLDHSCYEDPAKMKKLLEIARDANINLLRVWGGGLIEDEYFYSLCDEMGIMVWQEFNQSSSGIENCPSKIPEFQSALHDTAVYAAKTLRNHPSLAVFSGGNELFSTEHAEWLAGQPRSCLPADFSEETIGMLLGVVTVYAPHVPMLPTSASGPNDVVRSSEPDDNHDVHGHWKYLGVVGHYDFFNRSDSLFHSEFGVDGLAQMDTLRTFLSEKNLRPDSMGANHVWRHHGAWWDTNDRDNPIFGKPETLETQIVRSQFMQAEGLRYAVEANRRRAFRNSGSVIWQLNEPYPNVSCTSMTDYLLNPKQALYQVAKAFAPLNLSLRYGKLIYEKGENVTVEVFAILDDEPEEIVCRYGTEGNITEKTAVTGNGRSVSLGEYTVKADGAFVDIVLEAHTAKRSFRNTVRLLVKGDNGRCSDAGLEAFMLANR